MGTLDTLIKINIGQEEAEVVTSDDEETSTDTSDEEETWIYTSHIDHGGEVEEEKKQE